MTKSEMFHIATWLQDQIAKKDEFDFDPEKAAKILDENDILPAYPSNANLALRNVLRDYPNFIGSYQKSKWADWHIYNKRIIAMRVAWMKNYNGLVNDTPVGAGSYVTENEDGGEAYNFRNINGICYGYARNQKDRNYLIETLGASKSDEKIEHVTVIFFATNPVIGGQYIVGWYKDATFYRQLRVLHSDKRENRPEYICKTLVKNATLLRPDKRFFNIAADKGHRPGETNHWYIMKDPAHQINEDVWNYIHGKSSEELNSRKTKGKAWQPDIEKRKKVEMSAMEAIADYFEALGYTVTDVSSNNVGWDLEANKTGKRLLLEVKGLSDFLGSIELTPNEYTHSKKSNFRLCIVEDALAEKRVSIFQKSDENTWRSAEGLELEVEERVSARIGVKG